MANEIIGKDCPIWIGEGGSPAGYIELENQVTNTITSGAEAADSTNKNNDGFGSSTITLRNIQVTGTFNVSDGSAPGQERLFQANMAVGTSAEVYIRAYETPTNYYEGNFNVELDIPSDVRDLQKANYTLRSSGVVTRVTA